MIDVTIVPHEVKVIAQRVAAITKQIEAALNSNVAIDLKALFPEASVISRNMQLACEVAIKGCNALIAVADSDGVKGRLQRLGSDLTRIEHDNAKHSFSYYCECFEAVFSDLFGK